MAALDNLKLRDVLADVASGEKDSLPVSDARQELFAALDEESVRAVQTNKKPEHRTGQVSDLMFGDYLRLLDGDQPGQALADRADLNIEELTAFAALLRAFVS
ncbi:hypothetical protein [Streptomyces goshikiensis]|uniref:hypothetical protein n=1 Tax=Streptomyces goshikiensis TaxID=1942 RepID=UPI0036CEDDB9